MVGADDGIRARVGARWISVCNLSDAGGDRHIASAMRNEIARHNNSD
jgi:hypothetical protein